MVPSARFDIKFMFSFGSIQFLQRTFERVSVRRSPGGPWFFFSKVWLRLGLAHPLGISYDSGPLVPGSPGPITAYGASEKIGLQKNNDICGFESLRLLRSQETANTVFADLERLRMLQTTAL